MSAISVVLATVLGVLPSVAVATPTVTVDAPTIEGEVPSVWPERIHARAVDGFRAAGLEAAAIGSAQDAEAAESPELPESTEVTRLSAHLQITANGRDFELQLVLRDTQSDETLATIADACDTCGFSELAERVDALTASAVRSLDNAEPRPAMVTLRSQPAGATVVVDGASLGSTPLQTTLPAGEHMLTIRVDGHRSHEREIVVAPGEVVAYDVTLVAEVVPSTRRDKLRRDKLRRGLAAGGFGVGLSVAAAGGTLVWLHGRPIRRDCADDNMDMDGQCRFLHDTRAAGITMTVLGGAAAIAGATVVGLLWTKRRAPSRVALRPAPGGVELRF